jgi:hypothetical protein
MNLVLVWLRVRERERDRERECRMGFKVPFVVELTGCYRSDHAWLLNRRVHWLQIQGR